jgi:hypothetical protein
MNARPDINSPSSARSARRRRRVLAASSAVCAAWLLVLALDAPVPAGASATGHAAAHFACSGPNSSKKPCHFSTPSGNIRCLWTPSLNSVECLLPATGRAYRLRPTGKAKSIHLTLHSRGETLPTNQQIVFPESLSCHDTSTTMTCNQDFGFGFFKLARKGSRSG